MSTDIKKGRSPNYPRNTLQDAIEMVRTLHSKAGRANIKPEVAIGPLGYTTMNGAALGALSTLTAYGLVDRERGGSLTISDLALRLLYPKTPEQAEESIREAALSPFAFSIIHSEGYHDCSEGVLANHLTQDGFTAEGAKKAASIYKQNAAFAKLDASTIVAPNETHTDIDPATPSPPWPASPPKPVVTDTPTTPLPRLQSELPIPLDGGQIARVPFPMSEDTFDLLIGTLQLWKKRIVKADRLPESEK